LLGNRTRKVGGDQVALQHVYDALRRLRTGCDNLQQVCPVADQAKPSGESVKVNGSVKVAELSGSESIIHFDMLGNPWVSLTAGIHPYFAGEKAELYMDVAHGFYFAADGKLIGM
jgi:hypothetical protein